MYVDFKVTMWTRAFLPEGTNEYDIIQKIKDKCIKNIDDLYLVVEPECWEAQLETECTQTPDENDGEPTIEAFDDEGNSLCTNI
jgi:hypothetical protein